jgi:uncharacterized membrane protein YagU involved in acid resistance
MRENTNIVSDDVTYSHERPRAFDTILYGGLAVGVLDALDAIIFYGIRNGTTPTRIFQHIASGVLGRAAFDGGYVTALLGFFLHFMIAFIIAAIYFRASISLPMLVRRAVVWGVIYGVAVYFVMNYVVLPFSAAPLARFAVPPFLNGVIGHALLVGLPVALIAQRSIRRG